MNKDILMSQIVKHEGERDPVIENDLAQFLGITTEELWERSKKWWNKEIILNE